MDQLQSVREQTVSFYAEAAKTLNVRRAIEYKQAHDQWAAAVLVEKQAGRWEQSQGRMLLSKPRPAPLLWLQVDYSKDQYVVLNEGPETVLPELPVPDLPAPSNEALTEFRLEVPGFPGYWYAGNSTGPAGRKTTRNGVEYVLTQIGEPGSSIYRKLWMPVVG